MVWFVFVGGEGLGGVRRWWMVDGGWKGLVCYGVILLVGKF